MNESLYDFIQRTLVTPEYHLEQGRIDFERRLHTGEEKMHPMEMSWVVSGPSTAIRNIVKL